MHRSRNSEILLRPTSPFYRGRDNYSYDYIFERPVELSRRSRSLECGRDFLRDSYIDDYDDRKFERTDMINATLPRRRYDYQPFYVTTQPRDFRFYRDEPMRFQAIETAPTSHYSPRQIDYEWRYDRSFREKSGSPILPSSQRDDYDYRDGSSLYNGNVQQRSCSTWNRSYYTEPSVAITNGNQSGYALTNTPANAMITPGMPAIMNTSTAATNCSGYYPTANVLNKNTAFMKPAYSKNTYLRRDNREIRYRMIHCCCFHFRWPLWSVEDADPPRPMYRHY
uniref:Uncharacterized protein n=1 Tax=Syphacia muris TaxID=451379 RepID=A0A0N5AY32_9BILA